MTWSRDRPCLFPTVRTWTAWEKGRTHAREAQEQPTGWAKGEQTGWTRNGRVCVCARTYARERACQTPREPGAQGRPCPGDGLSQHRQPWGLWPQPLRTPSGFISPCPGAQSPAHGLSPARPLAGGTSSSHSGVFCALPQPKPRFPGDAQGWLTPRDVPRRLGRRNYISSCLVRDGERREAPLKNVMGGGSYQGHLEAAKTSTQSLERV